MQFHFLKGHLLFLFALYFRKKPKKPVPEINKKTHRREKGQSLAKKLRSNGHEKDTVIKDQRFSPTKSIRNVSTKKDRHDFSKNTLNLRHKNTLAGLRNVLCNSIKVVM
jgi:hypothetical protein